MYPTRGQGVQLACSDLAAVDVRLQVVALDSDAQPVVSRLVGGRQKHSDDSRLITHRRGEFFCKTNTYGVGVDHPPVPERAVVTPHCCQVPFSQMMLPGSGVRQIQIVAFDHAMLDVMLRKLGMEFECRSTLSNPRAAPDKQHLTSNVHVLSMVQDLNAPESAMIADACVQPWPDGGRGEGGPVQVDR